MFTYTFQQDKNILFINGVDKEAGVQRNYTFDLNTATLANSKGRVLNTWPQGFATYIRTLNKSDGMNAVALFRIFIEYYYNVNLIDRGYQHGSAFTPRELRESYSFFFRVGDKLQSIGYRFADRRTTINEVIFQCIDKHFKDFAKYHAENPDDNLSDFYTLFARTLFFKELPELDNYHLTQTLKDNLFENFKNLPREKILLIAYWYSRGVAEYDSIYGANNKINEFFRMSKDLDRPIVKCDFFREYINVKRMYEMKKKEISDTKIVAHHSKHLTALNFEDDTYQVIVPMTCDEFQAEAEAQHNCVYSMYLERVVGGNTNVVFVRRKNALDTSLITCEVNNNGTILQYLYSRNRRVDDAPALAFYEAYKRWLKEHWHD